MLTKSDMYLLLAELQDKGIDTKQQTIDLARSQSIPMDILKFINDNRQLDLTCFYEKIRKSYNHKKSNLYINIVKDIDDPNEVLTTLSALLTQILIFSKNVENKQMFLSHARADDISKVLYSYFKTYNLQNCIDLLRIIKADLKAIEYISKN